MSARQMERNLYFAAFSLRLALTALFFFAFPSEMSHSLCSYFTIFALAALVVLVALMAHMATLVD